VIATGGSYAIEKVGRPPMVSVTAEQDVSAPLLRASWDTMTFVHWRVEPERIQALLPEGLQVDVYDGSAWVGLTPFVMGNMRPLSLPDLPDSRSIPGRKKLTGVADVASTPETNLRTYVRGPDGRDGLWFLTIDAGNAALAALIRAAVGAPYHHADMAVTRDGDTVTYTGSRRSAQEGYRLQVQAGDPITPSELDIWVTSRWRAYTYHLGRLLVTPVEHEPWPLREATVGSLDENLTNSVGLHGLGEPELVHYSDGVKKVRLGRPALLG
jgi:uncharacterized protein YqjF (DUF2071 family)